MSLARDLLEQAEHLATREPRRPRQASLRRAISTAYYAMFHLMIEESTSVLVSRPDLRPKFARSFDHQDMKQASRAFAVAQPGQLRALTGGVAIPPDLKDVAAAFAELQESRHEADYNTDRSFTRQETLDLVAHTRQTFAAWQTIRTDPAARIYLAALLLWKKWSR